jgi:hypothetical protein
VSECMSECVLWGVCVLCVWCVAQHRFAHLLLTLLRTVPDINSECDVTNVTGLAWLGLG